MRTLKIQFLIKLEVYSIVLLIIITILCHFCQYERALFITGKDLVWSLLGLILTEFIQALLCFMSSWYILWMVYLQNCLCLNEYSIPCKQHRVVSFFSLNPAWWFLPFDWIFLVQLPSWYLFSCCAFCFSLFVLPFLSSSGKIEHFDIISYLLHYSLSHYF